MVMNIYLNGSCIGKVNGPLNKVSFYIQDAVQDEIRGYLICQNGKWSFIGVDQYRTLTHKKQCKNMVLLLESPHKDEFDSNYVPLRPANGRTGTNINKKLSSRPFTTNLDVNFDYQVLIMNPIQLQCSCYHQFRQNGAAGSSRTTNKVFRCLFNSNKGNLRENFIQRLKQYQADYVLNCSTCGTKSVVETAIKKALGCNSNYKDTHPSFW